MKSAPKRAALIPATLIPASILVHSSDGCDKLILRMRSQGRCL
jgi:hypothetical protein